MKHTKGNWLFNKTSYTILPNGEETSQSYTISTTTDFNQKNIANIRAKSVDNSDPLNDFLYPNEEAQANAKLIAAAPELLNSAILDNMFPTTTPKEQVEAEEFAESLGWKWDMPLEHFARKYRTSAILKATK